MNNIIGLFGTCGRSKWRDAFIERYLKEGIEFFNPYVPDWKPELAVLEAEHLADDSIVLFPITSEEYSLGSLSEVGLSVVNALKLDNRRDFVVLIDQSLDSDLEDRAMRKASLTARALVKQHLLKTNLANVYFVDNLADMLEISVVLFKSNEIRKPVQKFSISRR